MRRLPSLLTLRGPASGTTNCGQPALSMEIAILFALIVLNGLFAMSEISLVTARKARLQKLIDEGDGAAAAAVKLGEDPNRFLSTIQIGITSIGILNGIVGEAAFADYVNAIGAGPEADWAAPVEIVRRVREQVGPQFLLMYRVSALDLVEGGAPAAQARSTRLPATAVHESSTTADAVCSQQFSASRGARPSRRWSRRWQRLSRHPPRCCPRHPCRPRWCQCSCLAARFPCWRRSTRTRRSVCCPR